MSCLSCTDSDNEEKKDSPGFFSQILPNFRSARVAPAPALPNAPSDRLPHGWNPKLEGVVKYQRGNYGIRQEPFISKEGYTILTRHMKSSSRKPVNLSHELVGEVVKYLELIPRDRDLVFLQRLMDNGHNFRGRYPYYPLGIPTGIWEES